MADNLFNKASEVFGKGMDAASGIFDKGMGMASDVVSSAGDLGKRATVRAKIADANLEYERLMKRLGTALYEELKNDPKYADANQALFREIQTCVDRRQALEDELSEIDVAATAGKPIDVTPVPPEGAAGEPAKSGTEAEQPAAGAGADAEKADEAEGDAK